MTDTSKLAAEAAAISTSSARIRTFAQDAAANIVGQDARIAALEAKLAAPSPIIAPSGRWFADTAYINRVVPANPAIDPNSAAMINVLKQAPGIWTNGLGAGGEWSPTVYHADAATPTVTVTLEVPANGSITFPCAPGWTPPGGTDTDKHMIVIAADGSYWEFQALDLPNKHAHSVARGNIWTGDGVPTAANRISVLPTPVGLIRPEEVAAGVIPHGLRATIGYASPGFRWPAIESDGNTPGGVPSGAQLWLPRSVDISWLSTYARMVAKAIQEYRCWVGDSGGQFSLFAQSVADGKTAYPFTSLSLPQSIIGQLVVLAST